MFTQIDGSVHVIRDNPAVRFLRRELKDPSLFTFWNVQTGKWVLAWWLYPSRGVAVEVEDLGDSFEAGPQLDRKLVHALRFSWSASSPTFKDTRKRIVENERAKYRRMVDRHEEHAEAWNWAKKRDREMYFH